MEKMRSSTTYILWILILSFGLLWMLADTKVFNAIMAGPRSLGKVNGEPISLKEYNSRIRYYTEQYSQRTGNSVTPEMRAYYEQQAWNELVASKLMKQKMDEMGIKVTDAELVDMITGKNPDAFIKKQFQKKDGTIDRVALQSAIDSPENTQLWIMIEQRLRQKRRQQKMNDYIQSALEVTDYEIRQEYIRENSFADISYVRFPYSEVQDQEINVTDADLRDYYQTHESQFKRKRTYRFDYVGFDKTPTKQDTARTIREMKNLRSDFASAENDSLFMVRQQSDNPYSNSFVKKSDIRDEFKPVLKLKNGEVSNIIMVNGTVHLLKKLDERKNEIKFLDLSRQVRADPIETVDKASEAAGDFSFYAEQSSFSEEAQKDSREVKNAFATKGNPFVAGIGQSQQIMQFLNGAEEDDISKPIELDNQFVVIKVNQIQSAGVRPFDEVKDQIQAVVKNEKRKDKVMQQASKLTSANDNLEAIAKAAGREVKDADNVRLSATTISDAGREPEVIGAIFGLEPNKVSKPIPGNNAAFVVKVKDMQKADPDNLDASTRQQIQQQLQQQKNAAYMRVWMDQLKKEADIVDYRSEVLK